MRRRHGVADKQAPRLVRGPSYMLPALLLAAACAQAPEPIPPEPAPPGVDTFVSASFDLTWTALLDHFATVGIPIAVRDAGAGVIETDRVAVEPSTAAEYADCGSGGTEASPEPYLAASVAYRVEVRDNGSWSSVLVTAAWDAADPGAPFPCQTTGVSEAEVQEAVRLAAEANR